MWSAPRLRWMTRPTSRATAPRTETETEATAPSLRRVPSRSYAASTPPPKWTRSSHSWAWRERGQGAGSAGCPACAAASTPSSPPRYCSPPSAPVWCSPNDTYVPPPLVTASPVGIQQLSSNQPHRTRPGRHTAAQESRTFLPQDPLQHSLRRVSGQPQEERQQSLERASLLHRHAHTYTAASSHDLNE
jgi:hypothetical protein